MSVTTLKNRIKNTWRLDWISQEFSNYSTKYLQSVAYDIFNHDFTRHVLTDIASKYSGHVYGEYAKYVAPIYNPLRRIAVLRSQLYISPVLRIFTDPNLQVLANGVKRKINQALNQAQQTTNATGNVILWPMMKNGKIEILIGLAHLSQWEVTRFGVDVVSKIEKTYYAYDAQTGIVTVDDDPTSDVYAPVICGLMGVKESIQTLNDLIIGTISIAEMETFSNRVNYLKSFKQPILPPDSPELRDNPDQLEASPGNPWPLAPEMIDLMDKDSNYEDLILKKLQSLSSQHGISEQLFFANINQSNGTSVVNISPELKALWASQMELWTDVEETLWESIANGLGMLPGVQVQYSPNPILVDKKAEFELFLEQRKHGLQNTLDYILANNQWLESREEAEDWYDDNLAYFASEINIKRALNLPDVGATPQQNGALGGPGPSMVQSEDRQKLETEKLN